jgi:hypothetical protein
MPVNIPQTNFPMFDQSATTNNNNLPLHNGSTDQPFMHSMNAMNLDSDIFQMMDDMNDFTGGGLTGLEQWGDLPANLAGMGDMNWTTGTAGFEGQSGPFQ